MHIRFRVRTSPTEANEWHHAGPKLRIGRADNCHLVFRGAAGELVSGRHVQIELSAQGAAVTDLGSTNGTYVNGVRLAGTAPLSVGDQLQLGQAGPRLDVLAIDLAAAIPAGADPLGAAHSPTAAKVSSASGTQLLLLTMHRQNQRSLAIMATLGLVGVMVVTGIVWRQSVGGDKPTAQSGGAASEKDMPPIARAAQASTTVKAPSPSSRVAELPPHSPASFTVTWSGGPDVATFSVYVSDNGGPFSEFQADTASKSAEFCGRAGHTYGFYSVAVDPRGNRQPKPTSADATTTVESIEAIVERHRPAIVWIGFAQEDKEFLYGSGWALRPNVVVTTATVAVVLQGFLEKSRSSEYGEVRFVVHHEHGSVRVKELRPHPKYDAGHPDADTSIAHNVAVALLDAELPATCSTCSVADDREMDEIKVSSALRLLGYVDTAEPGEPFDRTNEKVRLKSSPVSVISSDAAPADGGLSYRLMVAGADRLAGADTDLAGAPIFNDRGHVVGTLAPMKISIRMAGRASIGEWLAGVR